MRKLLALCFAALFAASAQAQVELTGGQARGQLLGTATNDAASAGNVGQEIISNVAQASPVSLANGVVSNLTSISLTAGDWNIQCSPVFLPAATTSITLLLASMSLTSITHDTTVGNSFNWQNYPSSVFGATQISIPTPVRRFSLGATTTVYCPVQANFGASTMTVYGTLRGWRMR